VSAAAAEVGLFPGVAYETYAQWPGLRSSYLRQFRRTALHARQERIEPAAPSPALNLGNGIHTAILEPELLEQRYAPPFEGDRRFNVGKAAYAEWQVRHAGKEVLTAKQWDTALRTRDALWRQPWAEALLRGKGSTELCVRWDDVEFGTPCKARIDRFCADFDGIATVCDLKTCEDASFDRFRADIERHAYGLQAAFYLDGLTTLSNHFRQFMWIVLEKSPPYAAALYVADDEVLDEGRRLYRTAIAQHLECERTGVWPGYSLRPRFIGRPPWARRRTEEDDAL